MTRRLWWRTDKILPLAEHAAATPHHHQTRQQNRAGWPAVPALIWSHDADGDWLSSNGDPTWYSADGTEYRVRAETWTHTATGTTGNPHPGDDGDGFLPLRLQHSDGRRTLLELLRFARAHGLQWFGVNPVRTSQEGTDRYVISHSRGDVLPANALWVPALVTCHNAGGGYYRALVADGYTALRGGLLCRFPRHEVERMSRHLHSLSIGDMPGEHPVLHTARDFVSVQYEETASDEGSLWIEDDRVPADADDHYAIGAYRWKWSPHEPDDADGLGHAHRPEADADWRDRPGLPSIPPGGRLLAADEAVSLLVMGDHSESRDGSLAIDAALIEAIRQGHIVACLFGDGRVAFTPATQQSAGSTSPTRARGFEVR